MGFHLKIIEAIPLESNRVTKKGHYSIFAYLQPLGTVVILFKLFLTNKIYFIKVIGMVYSDIPDVEPPPTDFYFKVEKNSFLPENGVDSFFEKQRGIARK